MGRTPEGLGSQTEGAVEPRKNLEQGRNADSGKGASRLFTCHYQPLFSLPDSFGIGLFPKPDAERTLPLGATPRCGEPGVPSSLPHTIA